MIEFATFWHEYPRKVGRMKAEKIWRKMNNTQQFAAIQSVSLWKQTVQWQSSDGLYIPYASTFLHQQRYWDEPWAGAFEETGFYGSIDMFAK